MLCSEHVFFLLLSLAEGLVLREALFLMEALKARLIFFFAFLLPGLRLELSQISADALQFFSKFLHKFALVLLQQLSELPLPGPLNNIFLFLALILSCPHSSDLGSSEGRMKPQGQRVLKL